MKKIIYFFILLILISCNKKKEYEFIEGESLQVLYENVWAYKNPDDLSSRAGILGYYNKVDYLGYNEDYPDYVKVKTNKGKEYYVKTSLLAPKRIYSIDRLSAELEEGTRQRSQYSNRKLTSLIDLSFWPSLVVSIILISILFLVWKNYYKIEMKFIDRSKTNKRIMYKPWFIKNALLSGIVIGAFHAFFAPRETEWFLYEGFSIIPNFPSSIDYILWFAMMYFIVSIFIAIIQTLKRFEKTAALKYSLIIFILMLVYFYSGLLFGGIVAAGLFFYGFHSKGSVADPKIVDSSKSERWNKLKRFYK